ncbi:two-component system response regulator DcuR [Erwinia sp. OLTSP20]|uniref:two-component system response regulator DcuR n=1 Tax=unclassified Erwinia TaxID=2622719 RepID=UPI000C179179|nr:MULTISPECIES: two-component system response regulator DcuR [unclassified Erwinia]PIJ48471.1 two-component system response regulator DcuR [Erwinia sp. OAMSP11]PIJ75967.1 two-component system response regulator DcuR [Erwinia sp. OLSSP12]PIJ78867.1 two-component system response regulator DcuR [Erwinia sp. OLCASP19]PIJ87442.1 two-component system response regulator DcuR [Erwinia sp. OLMTSP26]PIJ88992.1 two-component system response regulator DcuR [Erwinia sp. OLMDSP33]
MSHVLVVDDDAMVAELNRCYITQISGFTCCGVASTLQQARQWLQAPCIVDLVLLDIYLHQENGLDLLPEIRRASHAIDVIIISSAADAQAIKTAMHYGVADYLIKPFQFPRFEEALLNWRQKKNLIDNQPYYQQTEVDRLLHGTVAATSDPRRLPKGLTVQTLRTLCQWIDAHPACEFSTDELASEVGISRVSCRKYLIWLAQNNILFTSIHYGVTGRPVYRYRLQPEFHILLKQYCH